MNIAITGHRPNKLGNDYELVSPLIQSITHEILSFLKKYPKEDLTLITGMALGIDTLFAKIAINNNIPFIAAIPFLGQESKWFIKSKMQYYDILKQAKQIFIVDENRSADISEFDLQVENNYSIEKMQKRNVWMVDNCDILIAVWDGTSGGTANCVKYAEQDGKYIYRINPNKFLHDCKQTKPFQNETVTHHVG